MAKYRVMLVCGSGASSGFMAANIRKAASEEGRDMSVIARSESELENYADDVDCVLIGPHLAYALEDFKERVEEYDIKVAVLSQDAYAKLDGKKGLAEVLKLMGE